MVDLYTRKPIFLKADVWALGILLYKLAYFKVPFEESAVAIVSAHLSCPPIPEYSQDLKDLIGLTDTANNVACIHIQFLFVGFMLVVDPEKRPGIIQVMDQLCRVRVCPNPLIGRALVHPPEQASSASDQAVEDDSFAEWGDFQDFHSQASPGEKSSGGQPSAVAPPIALPPPPAPPRMGSGGNVSELPEEPPLLAAMKRPSTVFYEEAGILFSLSVSPLKQN